MTVDTAAILARPGGGGHEVAIVLRPLVSPQDFDACVALQRRTWGESFGEVVPPSLLKVVTRLGGIAVGAFDEQDTLTGFVFGITGVEHGSIVHWSHMLAVLPRAQNHGIARRLKDYQRSAAAKVGATTVYWTFDPLVARNAHLNFNKLGVRATAYVEDMYGAGTSPLHRGIGTDRLIVAWPVPDAEVAARKQEIAGFSQREAPTTTRVEIPADIEALQASDMASAQAWRARTRAGLEAAFASGLEIHGFRIDPGAGRGYYLLGPRA